MEITEIRDKVITGSFSISPEGMKEDIYGWEHYARRLEQMVSIGELNQLQPIQEAIPTDGLPTKNDACIECDKGESIYDEPEEEPILTRSEYAKAAYVNGFLNCYDWLSSKFQVNQTVTDEEIEKQIIEIMQQEFAHLNMVQACKTAERIIALTKQFTSITDEKIQSHIIKDCRNSEIPDMPLMDEQAYFEGVKWMRSQLTRQSEVKEIIAEDMKCDVYGNHPSVIIRTPLGTFCQLHAKFTTP